jgi:hypothetical protein
MSAGAAGAAGKLSYPVNLAGATLLGDWLLNSNRTVISGGLVTQNNTRVPAGINRTQVTVANQPAWSPTTALLRNKGAALYDGVNDGLVAQGGQAVFKNLHTGGNGGGGGGAIHLTGIYRTQAVVTDSFYLTIQSGAQIGMNINAHFSGKIETRIANAGLIFGPTRSAAQVFFPNTPFEIFWRFIWNAVGNDIKVWVDDALVISANPFGVPSSAASTNAPLFNRPGGGQVDYGDRRVAIWSGITEANDDIIRAHAHSNWIKEQGL